jgi:hypothetical protein
MWLYDYSKGTRISVISDMHNEVLVLSEETIMIPPNLFINI